MRLTIIIFSVPPLVASVYCVLNGKKAFGTKKRKTSVITRVLQLYPDLREVKLFNIYRYYYHSSMAEEELRAAFPMIASLATAANI